VNLIKGLSFGWNLAYLSESNEIALCSSHEQGWVESAVWCHHKDVRGREVHLLKESWHGCIATLVER